MERLRRAWEARELRTLEKPRRGLGGQLARREAEREIERGAVAFAKWLERRGLKTRQAAPRLGLTVKTLKRWMKTWEEDRMRIEARGRPVERTDRVTRNALMVVFHLLGPGVSVRVLEELFPDMGRRELEEMQSRYRDVHRKKTWLLVHALRWTRAGWTWTMDFTDAPKPIDGKYPYILVVRDLAAGEQLLALPVESPSAKVVRDALTALFLIYGAPLVIKSDNGSAFIEEEARKLLAAHRVWHLLSPPGTPEYNGSIEAGIGSLKTRAHHEAARNDRPGEWTCDDVEGARLQANQTARPWGLAGETPDEAWAGRSPVTPEDREAFARRVERYEAEARAEAGYLPGVVVSVKEQDAVNRVAISRALVARDLLLIRRRRIPLPFSKIFWKKIS